MQKHFEPEYVAERLSVPPKTVVSLLRTGALQGVKVGRHWRIPESSLERYLTRSTVQNDKPNQQGDKAETNEAPERAAPQGPKLLADLTPSEQRQVEARMLILSALSFHRTSSGLGLVNARTEFAALYKQQKLALPTEVYTAVRKLCAGTLAIWEKKLRIHGPAGLLQRYGRRSQRLYDRHFERHPKQRETAKAILRRLGKDATARTVHKALQEGFPKEEVPSIRTVQRYLKKF